MPSRPVHDAADFQRLLRQAREQSPEALGELWRHCHEYLTLVAHRGLDPQLKGKVSPSDIVQETFLEAQRDFACFQGQHEDQLLAWLTRILVHNMANVARRYRGTESRDIQREVSLSAMLVDCGEAEVPCDVTGPQQEVAAREETEQLEQALQRLPKHYRDVVRLRYELNLTFVEIGTMLECSADAARKLSARAVVLLRQWLDNPDAL